MRPSERIDSKPRTLKELSVIYQVSAKTFKGWLRCDALRHIRPEQGYYYSIAQVKEIIAHIGEP